MRRLPWFRLDGAVSTTRVRLLHTAVVRTLTERDALLGAWCIQCQEAFRVGERVTIKPSAPARHEHCDNAEAVEE